MTVQITIIGMGQIGTSLGLALSGKEDLLRRVGHDRDLSKARRAEKMGALDRVEINLPRFSFWGSVGLPTLGVSLMVSSWTLAMEF